jgi:hypothetical protein
MTDGYASYPEDEINKIKSDSQIMAKLDFKAIGFGGGDFSSSSVLH